VCKHKKEVNMRFGPWEIGLILLIVLVVFGAGKLPEVGHAFGRAIRSFKKAQTGEESTAEATTKTEVNKPA
jgi:sec-independent protein translocase protein TatA